jgi:hypothetical protein
MFKDTFGCKFCHQVEFTLKINRDNHVKNCTMNPKSQNYVEKKST